MIAEIIAYRLKRDTRVLSLTRKEVAKPFLAAYEDCSIDDWLEVLTQVEEVRVSRRFAPVMRKNLDEIGLSAETVRSLKKGNIWQVGDLVQKTEDQLRKLPEVNDHTLWEVRDRLIPWGLQLGMRVEYWPGIPCDNGADSVNPGIKYLQGLRISCTRRSVNHQP